MSSTGPCPAAPISAPMKIVILDGFTTNPGDLSWEPFKEFGTVEIYDRTPRHLTVERARGAEIVLTNKTILDAEVMEQLSELRYISVMATGYNAVDIEAAHQRGIVVSNVRGYSTYSVAQHVFALILHLTNRVWQHNDSVHKGEWSKAPDWCYTLGPTTELKDKVMGVVGLGQIGNKVADIASALGMSVLAHHKHPDRDARPDVRFVGFEELLQQSDILSLHLPLNATTQGIIDRHALALMKPSAMLVNTGRGGLIVEADLLWALEHGVIAAACLDVLGQEPPPADHPFFRLPNCIITPHMAWATREARQRLLLESVENIRAFLAGHPRNVITR